MKPSKIVSRQRGQRVGSRVPPVSANQRPAGFAGEAPKPGDTQLDTDCSTIWTFAGLPCLSMPILAGETGLPVGVQLVGSAEEDDRLFRTAAWLERHLQEDIADDA